MFHLKQCFLSRKTDFGLIWKESKCVCSFLPSKSESSIFFGWKKKRSLSFVWVFWKSEFFHESSRRNRWTREKEKCLFWFSNVFVSRDKCVLECTHVSTSLPVCTTVVSHLIWKRTRQPERKKNTHSVEFCPKRATRSRNRKKKAAATTTSTQPYRKVFNTHIEKFAYEPRLFFFPVLLLLLLFLLDAVLFSLLSVERFDSAAVLILYPIRCYGRYIAQTF